MKNTTQEKEDTAKIKKQLATQIDEKAVVTEMSVGGGDSAAVGVMGVAAVKGLRGRRGRGLNRSLSGSGCTFYNGMVCPFMNMTVRGFLWCK